jgi:coenzyme F420 hydrogenase subunit delta
MKSILVLGCGNRLFGDDGFGPEVVEYYRECHTIPEDVEVLDAGTGVRNLLFNIVLGEERPRKIIIVDAMDVGKDSGEVFELELSQIPVKKKDDFCMHSLPTSNLLQELQDFCHVEVKIISAQVEMIPDAVCPGLSKTLRGAFPRVCEIISKEIDRS